jgi:hypothetical protein
MPNFISNSAIEYFVTRKINKLNKKTKLHLEKKLRKWLRDSEGNEKALDKLPEAAPEWAYNAQTNGQDVFEFIPSSETNKMVDKLVAFLKNMELLSKSSQNEQFVNHAMCNLNSMSNSGIDALIKKADDWFKSHKTPSLLSALNINKRSITCDSGNKWFEAQNVTQLHEWGKELNNCLKDGHYDDEFEDDYVRIFGLYDSNHKILAASAFQNDFLLELEAKGDDGEDRYNNAKKYNNDLLVLIKRLGFTVESEEFNGACLDGELNNDLNIYQATDVSRTPIRKDGFSFWFSDDSTILIVRFDKYKYFFNIPLSKLTDKYEEIHSIWAGTSVISLTTNDFDILCRALQKLVTKKQLSINLCQYHEFSMNGIYWKDKFEKRVNTQIGILFSDRKEAWWQYGDDITKWCSPKLDEELSLSLRNKLFEYAHDTYLRYGAFESALSKLPIPLPDIATNELGEPLINAVKYKNKSINPIENWKEVNTSTDGKFIIKKRTVDDYMDTLKTEQYICEENGSGLVAGILVRQVSARKYNAYIQAPGCSPCALSLLESSLPLNIYSQIFYNHDVKLNNKYIDEYFYVRGNPVVGKVYLSELDVRVKEYTDKIYVFDSKDKLILLLIKENDDIIDFHGFIPSEGIKKLLVKILSIMNLVFSHDAKSLVARYGYRIGQDGKLSHAKPDIDYQSENVEIEGEEEYVNVILHREDESITVTLYSDSSAEIDEEIDTSDDDYIDLRKAILAAVDYYDLYLSLEDLILFGIEKYAGSYRLTDVTYPYNWSATKFGYDIKWTLDLKDNVTGLDISLQDSIISAPTEEFGELLAYAEEINAFIVWFNKEKAIRAD